MLPFKTLRGHLPAERFLVLQGCPKAAALAAVGRVPPEQKAFDA